MLLITLAACLFAFLIGVLAGAGIAITRQQRYERKRVIARMDGWLDEQRRRAELNRPKSP